MVATLGCDFFQLDDVGKQQLADAWQALTARYCADAAVRKKLYDELLRHYEARGRHYHNSSHLAALLRWWAKYEQALQQPDVVCFAIWFHDVIYRSRRPDNEMRSAEYAAVALGQLNVSVTMSAAVQTLIRATHQHLPDAFPEQLHHDGCWFLDFDLAILGSQADIYAEYARAIRCEYRWVPSILFRKGRRQVLTDFQQRPQIYFTTTLRAQLETQARHNLAAELAALA